MFITTCILHSMVRSVISAHCASHWAPKRIAVVESQLATKHHAAACSQPPLIPSGMKRGIKGKTCRLRLEHFND